MAFCSKKEITDLFWDADNTLWDWYDFHTFGMEAMRDRLAETLGITPEEATKELQDAYEARQVTDYGNVVENISIVRQAVQTMVESHSLDAGAINRHTDWILDLVSSAREAYDEMREKHLRLYPGARKVLEKQVSRGGHNYVLSHAPLYATVERLGRMKIDHLFRAVWAMEDHRMDHTPNAVRQRVRRYSNSPLPAQLLPAKKPNTNLADLLNVPKDHIRKHGAVIGDSDNDLMTAVNNGCLGFYAKYGECDPALLERFLKFASPSQNIKHFIAMQKEQKEQFISEGRIVIIKHLKELKRYL